MRPTPDFFNVEQQAAYQYKQLEQWLCQGIERRRWRPGEKLPSIRVICEQRQLSKATVQHALQRLEAQGLIEARPRSGYYVCDHDTNAALPSEQTIARQPIQPPRAVTVSDVFLDIMARSAAFDLMPQASSPSPAPGLVALNRALGRALRRQSGVDAVRYDMPSGSEVLREQIALRMARRGWPASADDLCMTAGCQNALLLALMATCQRGDIVAVESPGYFGSLQLLEQLGLQLIEIPASNTTGLDVDALAEALQRWPVKACIVSPAFATPAGSCMPVVAQQQLLALADQYDLAIIEDDIYGETGFIETPSPLKALDVENRVVLCGSFSKTLSRDLRLGWIAGARWHKKIIRLKLVSQLANSQFLQRGVADFIEDGGLASHERWLRRQLRLRCDKLLKELQQWDLPVQVSKPNGGLTLWLALPDECNTLSCYDRALQEGVVITPGPLFSCNGHYSNCLRISFAHHWDEQRIAALRKLPQLLAVA